MSGCLDGIRVLELARFQAGPRAGMVLSDLGAEVIKIEKLAGEETRKSAPTVRGQSVYFSVYNRGKKSICLDLRQDAGKAVFFDLLKSADFVLENFRPGTLEEMGLGFDELVRVKRDIILVRCTGFGQYGPYKDRPSFDPLGQAMSGLMSLTGKPIGRPVGTAFSVVDRTTALHATIGALAALRHRDRTGEGQVIDVCLMDSALTMVEIPACYYLATGEEGGESGRLPYEAKDGWVVVTGGVTAKLVERLAEMIGKDAALPQGAGGSLFGHNNPILTQWCKRHSVAEICDKMVALGIPVAPVLSIPQVVEDPHLWEREMLVKVKDELAGELHVPGLAIKLSKTPGKLGPVPMPGEHTEEILSALPDYDRDQIARLRAAKVIQ
ncbi:MAG: CoA transferase [Burkholderiales bacterium]|nr:CoA transferase [Burkholderiales bacterium]